jgi:hypothetical protein
VTIETVIERWNAGEISRAELVSRIFDVVEGTINAVPEDVRYYVLRYLIDLLIARRDGVPHIMIGSNLKE